MKNVLLVGFGNMGKNHFRALQRGNVFRVGAVMDPVADFSTLPESIKTGRTLSDFLNLGEIDAVIVAAPTELHFEVARQFIQKKKSILVEKPLAVTLDECNKLIKMSEESGVKIGVGHIERHNPAVTKLKQILDSKEFGNPYHFSFRRVGYYPKNVMGGNNVVLDLAIHDFDILGLLQGEVIFEKATGASHVKKNVIDVCDVSVRTAGGVSATFHASWLGFEKARIVDVFCEKAQIRADLINRKCFVIKTDSSTGLSIYNEQEVPTTDPLISEHAAFSLSLENQQSSLCTAKEGSWSVNLAEKAIKNIANTH